MSKAEDSLPIRVLLVDDHALVLEGIVARLEDEDGIEVVGQAHDGEQALTEVARLQPDVVMMDVTMPVMNGLEATRRLSADYPGIRILMLSMHDDREYILQLIQSGACGYILKDVSSQEMIKAIEVVHQGNTYFSSGASDALFKVADPLATAAPKALTEREKAVLTQVAAGHSNKEIARLLDISVRTVETHRQNIKQKLDIHNAAGLIKYAIEHGLLKDA